MLGPLRELLEALLRRARDGVMTEVEAVSLANGQLASNLFAKRGADTRAFRDLNHAATLSRAVYQSCVSWFLFSAEWLDAFALLLRSAGIHRVLEVGAGCGMLAAPMRRRGLAWQTTDAHPSRSEFTGDEPPEAIDALAALEAHGDAVEAVFWSWWPRGDPGDAAIAAACAHRRLPALCVGEGVGGCTGSAEFWGRPGVRILAELTMGESAHMGVDVPCWPGVQDRTWVADASLLRVPCTRVASGDPAARGPTKKRALGQQGSDDGLECDATAPKRELPSPPPHRPPAQPLPQLPPQPPAHPQPLPQPPRTEQGSNHQQHVV